MKRLTYLVVVWWMMFVTASAGCGKAMALSPEAAAVQGQAAVQTKTQDVLPLVTTISGGEG